MNTNRLVLVFVLGLAAGAAYYLFHAAGDAWQPPTVVKIQSEKELAALTPTWGVWRTIGQKDEAQGLLLRDGDYFFADNFPIRYLASDGPSLTVTFTDHSASIGDKVVVVLLEKEEGKAWLRNATDKELANIRHVTLPDEVDDATMSDLKRLAAANPNVDLLVKTEATLLKMLPLFKPHAIFRTESSGYASADVVKALANQPQVELLFLNASAPGSLSVITSLPNLRHLLLSQWNLANAGPLPAGLTNLKSLAVMDAGGMKDLRALDGAPAGLEELSLIGANDLTDLSGLDGMKNLRTLFVWGDKITDLSGLAGLKQLRWVGLPPNTSPEQFGAFVGAHPNLAILDMMGNKTVKDLAPLGGLKGLQGLILDGPYDNLNAVEKLTSLRFVAVSTRTSEAFPDKVAAIRKALPDALVVTVKPLCLGSGWILLLVPVLMVMWILRRQVRNASRA